MEQTIQVVLIKIQLGSGMQKLCRNQTSFYDSTDRTFFITGVQLEVLADQATPFEHRSFGEELALCQRYHYMNFGNAANANGAT